MICFSYDLGYGNYFLTAVKTPLCNAIMYNDRNVVMRAPHRNKITAKLFNTENQQMYVNADIRDFPLNFSRKLHVDTLSMGHKFYYVWGSVL